MPSKWIFGKVSPKIEYGVLKFEDDGTISNYNHFNEKYWQETNEYIELLNGNKKVTTRFIKNTNDTLYGDFLEENGSWTKNVHWIKKPYKLYDKEFNNDTSNKVKFCGIYTGHDAGICIVDENGNVEKFISIDRIVRVKKVRGIVHDKFDGITYIKNYFKDTKFIIVYGSTNYSTLNDEIAKHLRKENRDYLSFSLKDIFPTLVDIYEVNHYVGHFFSAWAYTKDNSQKLCIAGDGMGYDIYGDVTNNMICYMDNNSLMPLEKDCFDSSYCLDGIMHPYSAGKLMGLSGYYPNSGFYDKKPIKEEKDFLIKCAGFYKYTINKIQNQIGKLVEKYDKSNGICICGGTTLSLELNTWLYNNISKNITYCPATDDSGQPFGLAAYGYFKYYKKHINKISTPFLQDYIMNDNYSDITIDEIVSGISNNKVYGLVRGKPEIGPRALGHRSIISNCRKEMYKFVSSDLKNREYYRPIAPIVTYEQFDELFDGPKSEYMHYRVMCKEPAQKYLGAICHVDNSSRPQVIYKEKDPWLHQLLVEVGKKTGFECLVNTSLNKNAPICNTYEDALSDFRGKDIEILNLLN